MKVHTATAGMLCLAACSTGACVMPSTYDEAVADLEVTKAEPDSTSTQSQVLSEQVSELQQPKIDLARHMEAPSPAVQRAKQKRETEHTASQERLNTLNRTISQLTAQQNRLRYALQRANEERPALQSVVERYTSKLGEADGPRAPLSPPPIARTNKQAETALAPPAQVAAQTDPAPKPTVTTAATPADPTAANPKPQPANKQTSEPVEDGRLSTLKGWVVSLWRSIFSQPALIMNTSAAIVCLCGLPALLQAGARRQADPLLRRASGGRLAPRTLTVLLGTGALLFGACPRLRIGSAISRRTVMNNAG